jgi:hypothetical protein
MSFIYQIEKGNGISYILSYGPFVGEDYLRLIQRLTSDPDWPPRRRLQLTDARLASANTPLDEATMQKAVDLYNVDPEKLIGFRAATVAHETFERAAMFQKFSSGLAPAVIVFNSMDTACLWLGIDLTEAERVFKLLLDSVRSQ